MPWHGWKRRRRRREADVDSTEKECYLRGYLIGAAGALLLLLASAFLTAAGSAFFHLPKPIQDLLRDRKDRRAAGLLHLLSHLRRLLMTIRLTNLSARVLLVALVCWPRGPEPVDVNFVTEEPYFEATIFLDGRQLRRPDGSPYTTPCTVEDLPAAVHHVVFKHDGLPDRDAGRIDFGEVRQIVARWDAEP